MTRPSDEMLNAYVDGALDTGEREAIEAYLATDADARVFVEMLRTSNEMLSASFSAPMRQPPPRRLVDAIMKAPRSPQASRVVTFRRKLGLAERRGTGTLALAASFTLLIGLAVGAWLAQLAPHSPQAPLLSLGPVTPNTPLQLALESKPSGDQLLARDGDASRRLAVLATFEDRAGRVCREVELLLDAAGHAPVAAGVACRDPATGHWVMEGTTRIVTSAPHDATGYIPSGVSEADALRGLLETLGAKPSMTPDAERLLIERGWK